MTYGSRYYVVLWYGNHGTTMRPGFETEARAKQVAKALEKVLRPEYEREKSHMAERLDVGRRPKAAIRTRPDGPTGFTDEQVRLTIKHLHLREWAIEDEWISFADGRVLNVGDLFRVVDWKGQRYRGAKDPVTAIKAFDRGMTA